MRTGLSQCHEWFKSGRHVLQKTIVARLAPRVCVWNTSRGIFYFSKDGPNISNSSTFTLVVYSYGQKNKLESFHKSLVTSSERTWKRSVIVLIIINYFQINFRSASNSRISGNILRFWKPRWETYIYWSLALGETS